jgi:hypothetical protein
VLAVRLERPGTCVCDILHYYYYLSRCHVLSYRSCSGVTYYNANGLVAMWKQHMGRDFLTFQSGMNMTWKNQEDSSCPNSWGAPAAPLVTRPPHARVGNAPAVYNTLVFYYVWPADDSVLTYGGRPAAQWRG